MKRKALIWAGIAVFATGYFVLDVRQRARVDRGVKRHRTDFTVYQAAAEALVEGTDPYEARNPRGYRYVYPPLLAVLLMPVAAWNAPDAALVFFLISAAGLAWALVLLARMRRGRDGPRLGWGSVGVAAFVCVGFAHQGFQRGQVTHILLGLQVGALAALLARRGATAGVLLGLAGALRLTPLLPAAAVGLGLLVAGVRGREHAGWLRYAGGLLGGLVLGFVVLPALALGPQRATDVTQRWLDVTAQVYGAQVSLEDEYAINEWRFKNQAPRRVLGTWSGWAQGTAFEKERPVFGDAGSLDSVNAAASALGGALLFLALLVGAVHLRDPTRGAYPLAFAAVVFLPVLVTRYTWPTHYLMALPALALAAAAGPWRIRGARAGPSVLVLLVGALLFYAAHARPLQWLGEAGCLMLACVLFLGIVLVRGLRETSE